CQVWTRLRGLSTVSLRYFNVFGPGQHPDSKYAALFPALIAALATGRAPEIHWDGEQTRDFTFVEDVARANLLAAQAPPAGAGPAARLRCAASPAMPAPIPLTRPTCAGCATPSSTAGRTRTATWWGAPWRSGCGGWRSLTSPPATSPSTTRTRASAWSSTAR